MVRCDILEELQSDAIFVILESLEFTVICLEMFKHATIFPRNHGCKDVARTEEGLGSMGRKKHLRIPGA